MKEELNREGILFKEARRLTSPEARGDFLARACGEDSALRKRIEARVEAAPCHSNSEDLCDAVFEPAARVGISTPSGLGRQEDNHED
jgi:hypothetical protein